MGLSALRSVGDAIDATREFMLPVSLRRWATMAVVVLFLGAPGTPAPANPQFLDPNLWRGPEEAVAGPPDGELRAELPFDVADPATWPEWLWAILLAAALLSVLYLLVGVLMRFVLVEALARDEVRVGRDAASHVVDALRVFAFRAGLWLVAAVPLVAVAVAVAPVGPWTAEGLGRGAIAAVGSGVALLAWTVDLATMQFVVPTMVRTESGVLPAWRRFAGVLRSTWREYAAFGVVRTLLGIGVGIAALVCVLVVLAFGAVLVGTVGAIVVLLAGGLGSLGTAGVATLALLVAGFLVFALVAFATVSVPFQVYLWVYALLVLGDTDADLDLVAEYREIARSTPERGGL